VQLHPFGTGPGILKDPFGALAKAQGVVMPLAQGVAGPSCVNVQDRASTHTSICLRVRASFRGRHPSLILKCLAVENSPQFCVGCFSGYLPCTHAPGCLAQRVLLSSSHSSLVPCWKVDKMPCSCGWPLHVKHIPASQESREP